MIKKNDIILKFGKYKNKSLLDIIKKDPDYCVWLIHQQDFEEKNPTLFNLMISNGIKFDKEYEKQQIVNNKRKETHFCFGKYKNHSIESVFQTDPKYCEYMVGISNIKKFHPQTVDAINKLSEYYG